MSSPVSVFKGLSQDRPLYPDGQTASGGQVLFDDNFASGLGMWRDHMGVATPYAPLSLSTLRAWPGSAYSMMLSTCPRPQLATISQSVCAAYRNESRNIDAGKICFEVWVAIGSCLTSNTDTDNTMLSWNISIDAQSWDNTHRGHPTLTCAVRTGPDSTSVISNAWRVSADNGDQIFIDMSSGTGVSSPNVVPSVQAPSPGLNENKLNFFRAALWYDLSTVSSTDGKPGRYYRAEMGPTKVDLTGFLDSAGHPIGRSATTPQTTSAVGGGSFAGGLNFSIGMGSRGSTTIASPPWMLVARARAIAFPVGVTV